DAFAANAVVYPNPVSGEEFFIQLPNQEQTAITVYNSLGQLVHNSQTTSARNAISTINWNSGIYFVKLKSATSQQTIKLIVK
ncbi:MAG: T9SS type A sorting domain-containing protein, partial [Nonlabens sp.]|nr:T9SS type A sorting domain-containing protein [Nonlabens sp.]